MDLKKLGNFNWNGFKRSELGFDKMSISVHFNPFSFAGLRF